LSVISQTKDSVDFHSEIAAEFHASYQRDANRLERVKVWRDFFDRYMGGAKLVYDMGCGSGVLACEIASRNIRTIGIDGSAAMLEIARQTARDRSLANIEFQQHRLPVGTEPGFEIADVIISSSCIEYLDSVPDALAAFRNILKPGGVIIFSMSNHDSLSRKLVRSVHRVTGRPAYLAVLKHFTTVAQLKRDVAKAQLTYLEHGYFARADRINRFLSGFIGDRWSSNMIIMAARRD
jgi:2-polyprenyl-3-methyl-5-hydroxy-6-metoxy-1,4-benzoquinol methylase